MGVRLYLPESWAQDAARRQRAQVPADVTVATKPESAVRLVEEADRWGGPDEAITAGGAYGGTLPCLAEVERRRERYVVAAPADFGVQVAPRAGSAVERAEAVRRRLPRRAWQPIRGRQGSRGRRRKEFVRLRCWRAGAEGRGASGWLLGQRAGGGPAGAGQYYFSNAGPRARLTSLVRIAHQRHHREPFSQGAKGELGWAQGEGRLWHGSHRHALLVGLASSFLALWRARQHRRGRGRPPRLFPPPPRVADSSGHPAPSARGVGH